MLVMAWHVFYSKYVVLMSNPILVEVVRGGIVESVHRGAFFVSDSSGKEVISCGGVDHPVSPRSAIKAFQALPMVASGAAAEFGLNAEEISLCCASHGGEQRHVAAAASILAKINIDESAYECGAHWPTYQRRTNAMIAAGESPGQIHNNCSGKHAGMLAFAQHLGVDAAGYIAPEHPVQQAVAKTIEHLCDVDLSNAARGVDGCSVPTWAIPLRNIAFGFARFASGEGLENSQKFAAREILNAVRTHPFMVAGTGRFCTEIMTEVPRLFIKTGAEGVFCGCVPHAGLGFSLKCDDGATRASEIAITKAMTQLDVWNAGELESLQKFTKRTLFNRRKIETGHVQASKPA
jgi:L-asparaginase II